MKKQTIITGILLSCVTLAACSSSKTSNKAAPSLSAAISTSNTSQDKVSSSQNSSTSTVEVSDPSTQARKMNLEEISAGDYSSIAGTWQNAKGYTLIFDEKGLVSSDGRSQKSGPPVQKGDILTFGVASDIPNTAGGYILNLIPSGVSVPSDMLSAGDTSDKSRDRMFGAQNILNSDQFPDVVYYKVN